jgi:aspartyl protease family protein
VDVNGTNLLFMVDTGATGIALTEEDARRAGVTLDGPRTYVGEGAGGALTGLPVRLGTVRLGDKSASMVEAVVIDGSSTNLLGQSFLSRFAEVTVRDDVMTLR